MSWLGVVGHDRVVAELRHVLARGRLGHAYMFVGPPGIGKKLLARRLTQTLLCEVQRPQLLQPCQQCSGCVMVQAGTHPDFIEVGRVAEQQELPIEQIRELIRQLSLKPERGGHRVAIIDDADDMNVYAANCLLKCLEEPPSRSLIILISIRPDRQLPTIRSRCQVIRFQPLSEEQVADVLLASGQVTDRGRARQLASMSDGSVERAMQLADPELDEFRAELARRLAGSPMDVLGLAERVSELAEAAGRSAAERRRRAKLLIGISAEFLHAALRLRVAGDLGRRAEAFDRRALERLAELCDPETLVRLVEQCLLSEYQVERNAYLPVALEAWADSLTSSLAPLSNSALGTAHRARRNSSRGGFGHRAVAQQR